MAHRTPQEIMVEEQLIARGISDGRVIAAFRKVDRAQFVPEMQRKDAFADHPILLGEGQTISQPYIVALMTELLQLNGSEKVLEIGTGSGYQTAILATLAREVFTIERIPSLGESAQNVLREQGYKNITFAVGDGTLGWPEESPFDRIIITAATPRFPLPLNAQLASDARAVAPLGEASVQVLTVIEKTNGKMIEKQICGCVFVPLLGKYGAASE